MKMFLLLVLLSVSECVGRAVVGRSGENITLACGYDIRYHGPRPVCWARGHIPLSGCGNTLVSTDGHKVSGGSSRFLLLGRLEDGDVSLTILNVTEADAGRYGCRVDVAGWFNDDKHHFDLSIEGGQVTSTDCDRTSSSDGVLAEQQERSSSATMALVWVLFVSVALITAGAGVIFLTKWRRLNKTREQQVDFRSTSFTLQLQSQNYAVENIYQIDEGGDGGEYEHCP
ncbi:hepatitis A virus cellular receptor 1 homolog [Pempheris klunzingeri]|uniref:hepatitis A virus cellular receptor 1 homolog n=1 Tax=Pempheris klunzingeri TaxID=3127111 RepID=UPI003980B121